MKAIAVLLALMGLSNSAQACLGGNLVQIVAPGTNTVIANYDIRTGKMVARSRSFQVAAFFDWEPEGVLTKNFLRQLCAKPECSELKEFNNSNVQVVYFNGLTKEKGTVMINNLTIGRNASVSRGFDLGGSSGSEASGIQDRLPLYECSKK